MRGGAVVGFRSGVQEHLGQDRTLHLPMKPGRRPPAPWAAQVDDVALRLELPHVVHVYDRLLAEHSVIGPFAYPIDACRWAETFREEVLPAGADPSVLEIAVVPLDPVGAVPPRPIGRRR